MLVKLEWLSYRTVKKLWRYVKPFSSCTGTQRTDRQTDLLDQYRASVCWRAIKSTYCMGKRPFLFLLLISDKHVSTICSTCFYRLRQIRRIRRSIDTDSAATLVHAVIASRVDYCNTVLAGSPKTITDRIQRVRQPESGQWYAQVWSRLVQTASLRVTLVGHSSACPV